MEGWVIRSKRPIYLVCGDMQKPELIVRRSTQPRPVGSRFFEQAERAIYIGADEVVRSLNRAIDVALGREVHNRLRPMRDQQLCNEFAIANVTLQKPVSPVRSDAGQIRGISRVGQLIDINDGCGFRSKPLQDEIRSDESRATGDKNDVSLHEDERTPKRLLSCILHDLSGSGVGCHSVGGHISVSQNADDPRRGPAIPQVGK